MRRRSCAKAAQGNQKRKGRNRWHADALMAHRRPSLIGLSIKAPFAMTKDILQMWLILRGEASWVPRFCHPGRFLRPHRLV